VKLNKPAGGCRFFFSPLVPALAQSIAVSNDANYLAEDFGSITAIGGASTLLQSGSDNQAPGQSLPKPEKTALHCRNATTGELRTFSRGE
jgi:hypothetical protein